MPRAAEYVYVCVKMTRLSDTAPRIATEDMMMMESTNQDLVWTER